MLLQCRGMECGFVSKQTDIVTRKGDIIMMNHVLRFCDNFALAIIAISTALMVTLVIIAFGVFVYQTF